MQTTYETTILGFGNHASIEIPEANLAALGANKRAPLKITIKGYTYQSTATGVDGKCMVVFPQRDRDAAGVKSGDSVVVTLELDSRYREVDVPTELQDALLQHTLTEVFRALNYSTRKEYARLVSEAKAEDTKQRRIEKIIEQIRAKQ